MKKKTLLIAVAAIVLAVFAAASVTVAWLTAESGEVTNTFTYGKIEIDLTESGDGQSNGNTMNFSRVLPGDKIAKNPVVTVKKDSEKCFVYVLVTNNLVLSGNDRVTPVVTYDISQADWKVIYTFNDGKSILYRYEPGAVDAYENDIKIDVFKNVQFNGALNNKDVEELMNITEGIIIKAYAHQSENTDVGVADDAAITWANGN